MSLLCSVIKKSGYCFYVASDACSQLVRTPKGMFIMKELIFSSIKQAHFLAKSYNKKYAVLDITVAQLKIADPFITKFATTLNAWQRSLHTLHRSGLSKRWRVLKCAAQTTAKTFSLVHYFDQLGAHSIDSLLKWDASVCAGMGARIGASAFFHRCGMQTVKGFINRLSILASVCAVIDAMQSYFHHTEDPHAKPLVMMQVGKETLKITRRVLHKHNPLQPYMAAALLALTIYQELFKIYYIGTAHQPPRVIPLPEYLQNSF